MPITSEFLDSFKQFVEQYSQSTSRGIIWKREDTHYESIKSTLNSLLDIITINKDMFDDLSIIDYLSRSAIKLLLSDYQFILALHQFSLEYDRKTNRLNNDSIDTGLYIQVNRNEPPKIDLIKQLQNVINITKKAHESEISTYEHQVHTLSCENESLRKENDILKKQVRDQLIVQKQSEQVDQVKVLMQKINQILNLEHTSGSSNSIPLHLIQEKNSSCVNQLSAAPAIPLVTRSATLIRSTQINTSLSSIPMPPPPPPRKHIINPTVSLKHSKISYSFFQELTATIQKFEERKQQTNETLFSSMEKNSSTNFLPNIFDEIAASINNRRKGTGDEDDKLNSEEELNHWVEDENLSMKIN